LKGKSKNLPLMNTDNTDQEKTKTFETRRNGGSGEKQNLPQICADER
jgi:hypothetical protein